MLLEKLADCLSFVREEIVEGDVNLLPRRAQGDDSCKKATNSRLVWRTAVLP